MACFRYAFFNVVSFTPSGWTPSCSSGAGDPSEGPTSHKKSSSPNHSIPFPQGPYFFGWSYSKR